MADDKYEMVSSGDGDGDDADIKRFDSPQEVMDYLSKRHKEGSSRPYITVLTQHRTPNGKELDDLRPGDEYAIFQLQASAPWKGEGPEMVITMQHVDVSDVHIEEDNLRMEGKSTSLSIGFSPEQAYDLQAKVMGFLAASASTYARRKGLLGRIKGGIITASLVRPFQLGLYTGSLVVAALCCGVLILT